MTDVQPARHADSAAAPGTPPDAHTVQRGDTLWAISRQYGLPLSDLIAANPQIANPDLIYPEQQIHLPAHAATDAAPPTASPVTDGRLVQGASGPDVATLQQQLRDLGYYHGNIGGTFGPLTDAAVRNFQRDHGLVVDGWAGPQTQAALQAATQGGGAPPSPPADGPRVPGTATTPAPGVAPVTAGPREARLQAGVDYGVYWAGQQTAYVGGASEFRYGGVGDGNTDRQANQKRYLAPEGVVCFDCSGLVVAMYAQAGVDLRAHGMTYTGAMLGLPRIGEGELRPGDLLVKSGHVMIYVGDVTGDGRGDVVEATPFGPNPGDGSAAVGGVRLRDAASVLSDPAYSCHRVPDSWFA